MEIMILVGLFVSMWLSPIDTRDIKKQYKNSCVIHVYSYKIGKTETIHVDYGERCNLETINSINNKNDNVIIYTNR